MANSDSATMQDKKKTTEKLVAQTGKTWGRTRDVDPLTVAISALIMSICPSLVGYFQIAIDQFGGALLGPALGCLLESPPDWAVPKAVPGFLALPIGWERLYSVLPAFSWHATTLCAAWIAFQAALYMYLPAKTGYGQQTPAGHVLGYKVNGLLAWFVTHALFIGLSTVVPLFPGSVIADNFPGLYIAANVYGYALTTFSYIKAHFFPTHPEDRKFSSSKIYDFYMGIEFNPRIGKWFDFKLFHNGRPGIVAWTLISYSFAVQQYMKFGYVTNSMVLVNLLHATYVIDFFRWEDWYLRTIDICHDHFGFYLAWGDSVWLPFMYTLQGHYLAVNPVQLSTPYAVGVFLMGAAGYIIFRQVNNQKDVVRNTDGKCLIWGKPPTMIRPKYTTSDGKEHSSILLTSGWWGLARHANYMGDLILSSAMCLACGLEHLTPYFYIVFMTILLVGRIYRDDARCRGKYGKYWEDYCKTVPYKLIPYVW
ncbi:ergosterol biosynthesis ERG4/ERG24 family-domain-containing protein [Blastocladiella britannica]|nr:ergosterol biosynthesis ERG4/ERG24 family-domain-containing protein [Blastocladiella britannica]